jgi:hypothetical protein
MFYYLVYINLLIKKQKTTLLVQAKVTFFFNINRRLSVDTMDFIVYLIN